MVSETTLRSFDTIQRQIASARASQEQVKEQTEAQRRIAQKTPTETQLRTQTRAQQIKRAPARKAALAKVAKQEIDIFKREIDIVKAEKAVGAQQQRQADIARGERLADAMLDKGVGLAALGLENSAQRKAFDARVAQRKAFKERGKALTKLGEGSFAKGIEKLKEQKVLQKEFGDLAKLDLEKLTSPQLSRFEKAGLISITSKPQTFQERLVSIKVDPKRVFQDLAEIEKRKLLVSTKGAISPKEPQKKISFKEKVAKFGAVTATTELLGDIFAESKKETQITNKAVSDIVKRATGITLPTTQISRIKEQAITRLTGLTPGAQKLAEVEVARLVGSTAPFFLPVVGATAFAISGVEQELTPGGKQRIKETQKFLEEKNIPKSLAHVLPAISVIGGTVLLKSEIKSLNKLSRVSTRGSPVTTKVISPNVRDIQVQKVLETLDKKTIGFINKNKLSAGRAYETITDGKKLLFVEFGSGTKGVDGFFGSRRLFGVELNKAGKIKSTIGGFSIEKVGQDNVARSITELIKTTRKRGRFTVTPVERKELIRIAEETTSTVVRQPLRTITKLDSTTTLIKQQELGKVSKIKSSDLAIDSKDALKIKKFLEGGGEKFGKIIGESKGVTIEQLTKLELKLSKEIKPSIVLDPLILKKIKLETRGIEAGKIITKPVNEIQLSPVAKLKKIKDKQIDLFSNKLPKKSRDNFNKLSKIEKLSIIGDIKVNKLNPNVGLTFKELNLKLKAPRKPGTELKLENPSPNLKPSGIPGIVAILPSAQKAKSKILSKLGRVGVAVGGITANIQAPKQLSGQAVQSAQASGTASVSKIKSSLGVKSDVAIKSAEAVARVSGVDLVSKVAVASREDFKTPAQIKDVVTKTTSHPKILPVVPLNGNTSNKIKKALGIRKQTDGWIPEIKHKGKFRRYTRPFKSKQQASNFADWATDNSTSARSRIKPVSNVKEFSKKAVPSTSQLKFRKFKMVRGKKIKLKDFGKIEKRRSRIDTIGERKQLSAARLIAKRFGVKKIKQQQNVSLKSGVPIKLKKLNIKKFLF